MAHHIIPHLPRALVDLALLCYSPQMTMVVSTEGKSETINEPLSDWHTSALVPLALLYYCPIAKPPLPHFGRVSPRAAAG